jgi:hypothetical protein
MSIKSLLNRFLKEQAESDPALPKLIISYFKHLNKNKPKNQKALKEFMKETLPMINISADEVELYYNLYKANYREDGRYDLITKDEFIGPENFSPKKITNTESKQFVKSKMPFRGSNLEGRWGKDNNGVPYYEVISYGWYPVYIFKDNIWFEAADTYSISTSKQMTKSTPYRYYDSNLGEKVLILSREEMQMLKKNASVKDIIELKKEKLISHKSELSKKLWNANWGWGETAAKAKFRITDAQMEDNKVQLVVKVEKVGKREGNKFIEIDSDYRNHLLPPTNKQSVERGIYDYIVKKYKEKLGTGITSWWMSDEDEEDQRQSQSFKIPNNLVFTIKFIH